MTSLKDRTIVIIGGSSGMGLATAQAAQAEGARLIITGRSQEKLKRASDALKGEAKTISLDSRDEGAIKALFAETGSIDHVLCAAGAPIAAKHLQVETSVIREAFDTRVMGDIFVAKYAAPKLREGGSITFIAGVAAPRPYEGSAVTSTACAAVEGLTRGLAVDLAPLRVNTIRPGYVDTELMGKVLGDKKDEYLAMVAKKLLVRRIGRTEDIADAALFLMKNGYVTGIVLTVDGGHLLV